MDRAGDYGWPFAGLPAAPPGEDMGLILFPIDRSRLLLIEF